MTNDNNTIITITTIMLYDTFVYIVCYISYTLRTQCSVDTIRLAAADQYRNIIFINNYYIKIII